jgi:carboxymethylenebutenolidase
MTTTIEMMIGDVKTSAFLSTPAGPGPHPGIVLTFHREGLDDFTADQADRFAAAGFAVLAPNHFHVLPPGKGPDDRRDYLTDEQQGEDCAAAARWLVKNAQVDPDRLAVLGHCMGGRTTVVALECNPELWRCGLDWYGGGVFRKAVGDLPAPGDVTRLERIRAPLAGFFGDLDTHPSPEDVDKLDALLTKLGKPHEFHRYPGVNHAFMNSSGKKYHPQASKETMELAIAFLRRHLQPK